MRAVFLSLLVPMTISAEDRIVAVESSLRPFAEAKGKPQTWTLSERMKVHGVPGVSIAVIENGSIVWAKGYGLADTDAKTPVTAETMFQAGSISKLVTGLTAMRLNQRGDLPLDADINTLLKDWKLRRDDDWKAKPVTLRQLLSHTAGVNVHGYIGHARRDKLPTNEETLKAVKVVAEPGAKYDYSGGGYQIVQQVLCETSGLDFTTINHRQLFEPLKLKRTTFAQPLPETYANVAAIHDGGKRLPIAAMSYPEQASAGLWSTTSDLALIAMELSKGLRGETSLFTRETASAILTRQPITGGKTSAHGLGPEIEGEAVTLCFSHTGGTVGFRSVLVMFPKSGLGAVIMTNGPGDALNQEILRSIANVYTWPGEVYKTKTIDVIAMDAEQLSKYAGDYAIEVNNTTYTLTVEGSGLSLKTRFKSPIMLLPVSKSKFVSTSHDRSVEFVFVDNSKILRAKVYAGDTMIFAMQPVKAQSPANPQ
jgi:CubicO group peptidase (beta-lactamase class C family)